MVHKNIALLALATGFAAAKPIAVRAPEELPAYHRRGTSTLPAKRNGLDNAFGNVNAVSGNFGLDFGNQFNAFQNQEQVIQVQEQNLQIVDNGIQQAVVQQAKEVLIVDQRQNNGFNNLFRKSFMRNKFRDQATVMLVVQEIQVAVDDGRGNVFQQKIFAQSAVVANRGARETRTVQVIDKRQLVATKVLGGFGGGKVGGQAFGGLQNIGGVNVAAPTGGADNDSVPATATNDIALFNAQPTWSTVEDDPAATGAVAWQAELEDLQKVENNAADNEANKQAAEQEKKALEDAQKAKEDEQAQKAKEDEQAQKAKDDEQAQQGDQAKEGEQAQQGDQAKEGEQAQQGDQAKEGEQAQQGDQNQKSADAAQTQAPEGGVATGGKD